MFAVLTILPGPRGLAEALRQRFSWGRLYRAELLGGGEYWRAEVFAHRRRIPWARLRAQVGEQTPWLLPETVKPPRDIRLLSLQSFREEALAGAAVRILNAIGISARRKSPVLVDRDGRYFDLPEKLLPFCVGMKVITGRRDRYKLLAGQMMERFGAVMLVMEWDAEVPSGTFFLDPQGHMADVLPEGSPVLTALPRQRRKYRAQVLTGLEAVPPEKWGEPVPDGIDFTGFLAACRGTPGWKGREEDTGLCFYCGEHLVTEAEIADYCERKCRTASPERILQ